MARSALLGGGSTSPFRGGGGSFSAFDVGSSPALDPSQQAGLEFQKIQTQWQAGTISNDDYLAALRTYQGSLNANSITYQNTQAQIDSYQYDFARSRITNAIDEGSSSLADLVAFDRQSLEGLNPGSNEYQQRLARYYASEQNAFQAEEKAWSDAYSAGQMTATQILAHYNEALPGADSASLRDYISGQIRTVGQRIQGEQDQAMTQRLNDGRITAIDFMAYAVKRTADYAPGTADYDQWVGLYTKARDQGVEASLTYRYSQTQRYADLAKFVADSSAPIGGTSTSTSTRYILQADGVTWKAVKTTSTKATAPSAAELKAYAARQLQVASAKTEMAQIKATIASQAGGWVTSQDMLGYYQQQQSTAQKGTAAWLGFQAKIDAARQAIAQEQLIKASGITISYPSVSSENQVSPTAWDVASESSITPDTFLQALANLESGGDYTARNAQSGAMGKYQILPSNWSAWAGTYLGDPAAVPTPDNQEQVARGKVADLYKWLGSWSAVAYWWNNGGTKEQATNPAAWTASGKAYVNKAWGFLGLPPVTTPSSGVTPVGTAGSTAGKAGPGGAAVGGGSAGAVTGGKPVAGGGTAKPGAATPRQTVSGPIITGGSRAIGGVTLVSQSGSAPIGSVVSDAGQFGYLYNLFQKAFVKGETTVTDMSDPAHPRVYQLPADPNARLAVMRSFDQTNISLAAQTALDSQGSLTEGSKSSAYSTAVAKANANELAILNFGSGQTIVTTPVAMDSQGWSKELRRLKGVGALTPDAPTASTDTFDPAVVNPLYVGSKILDAVKAEVSAHQAAAQAAYDRGDYGRAYSEWRLAGLAVSSADPQIQAIVGYANKAAGTIAAVEALPGTVTVPASVTADLNHLANWQADLAPTLAAGEALSAELVGTPGQPLTGLFQLDAGGNVVIRNGEPVLQPDVVRKLGPNGKIVVARSPTDAAGNPIPAPGEVIYNQATGQGTLVPVSVKFQTGAIGHFVDAAGNLQTINGRYFKAPDGKGGYTVMAQDPFSGQWLPTSINGNSATLTFKVPPNVTVIRGAAGQAADQVRYQWDAGAEGTYALNWDAATGTYHLINAPRQPFGVAASSTPAGNDLGVIDPGAGNASAQVASATSGWGIDTSTFTTEQRGFWQLGVDAKSQGKNVTGAFIGITADQASRTLLGPPKVTTVEQHAARDDIFGPNISPYTGFNLDLAPKPRPGLNYTQVNTSTLAGVRAASDNVPTPNVSPYTGFNLNLKSSVPTIAPQPNILDFTSPATAKARSTSNVSPGSNPRVPLPPIKPPPSKPAPKPAPTTKQAPSSQKRVAV